MNKDETTTSRKLDHVRIVLDEDVAAKGVYTGFASYRLPHEALPELDLAEVSTKTSFLNKRCNIAMRYQHSGISVERFVKGHGNDHNEC